jgi:hypothetical protein
MTLPKVSQNILGHDRRWPTIINIHAPRLDTQNAKFLQKMHVCIWLDTIESDNNGLVVCPFHYLFILDPILDLVCTCFIDTKKISNTKHLLTFHTKREVIHTNVIAFTPMMTIKSQINSIHTNSEGTITLHCRKFKKILAIVFSWEDLDFFISQIVLNPTL